MALFGDGDLFLRGKGGFLTFNNTVGIFKNLQKLFLLFYDNSSFLYLLLAQMPNNSQTRMASRFHPCLFWWYRRDPRSL